MKVTLFSEKVSEKIVFLNHAVSQRGQLPILSNFLLSAKGGKLTVCATDLEIGISTSIPVRVEKEGKTTVPAKNFSDLFSNLKSQKITMEDKNQKLMILGEKIKASFQTLPAEEFPTLFEEKGKEVISTKKEDIKKMFEKVVFAAATDNTRPALSGVLMNIQNKEAILVSSDGHRLSLQKKPFKGNVGLAKPIIIPSRIIRELLLMKEDGDVLVFVFEKNNQIIFSQGETLLVGRLIDDQFPEYEKFIPTDFATKTYFNKEELLNAIKICMVFARETANIVKFSIEKNKIVVSANSPSVGEDSVEVEAKTTGEENEIAFNSKYLLDFLTSVDKEELVFEMTGPLNPGVFKIENDSSFLHLIMPIRVQE
jgi:DNA polymerase-3 subunit beta